MAQSCETRSDTPYSIEFYNDPIEALSELPQSISIPEKVLDELTGKQYEIDTLAEQLEEENLLEQKRYGDLTEYSVIREEFEGEKWLERAYEAVNEF